jgi:hypothetical protein
MVGRKDTREVEDEQYSFARDRGRAVRRRMPDSFPFSNSLPDSFPFSNSLLRIF